MIERFFGIERRPTDKVEANLRTLRRAVALFDRDSRLGEDSADGAAVRRTRAELAEMARHVDGMLQRFEERLGR